MSVDAIQTKPEHSQFVKNMAILWRINPKLALALDAIDDASLPEAEPSKSGHLTVRRTTANGRDIYLHSRYDPLAEAKKWAANTLEEDKFCYIIEGFGLGYHFKELFSELRGDVIFIVVEPDLPTLRLALTHLDLTEEIDSRRMVILTELNKNRVHQQLFDLGSYLMMGTKIAAHQPSAQISNRFFTDMRPVLTDFIHYIKTSLVTLVINSQITCRNVAGNLATYLATPPINNLRSEFTGYPAIIVSAGPSLRKNVHLLSQIKGKAVIVATQTTFKNLLNRDIIPDFVCSLDYHELSRQYYEGLDDFRGVHLVAEPKAHHSVIEAYGGPISLLNNSFAQMCLGDAQGQRDGLPAGSSVAHLAFYLAEYLGCDPIILIGQDLAMTDHVYYAPGMAIHSAWQSELNRFCTMESKEWERIMRSKPILRKVKDYEGQDIYTEELMFNYLEQFEKDFARTHVQVIDATEGGAMKRGSQNMTLQSAINQFCGRGIDPALFEYRQKTTWFDPSRLADGRARIATRLEEMEEIRTLCDDTLDALESLRKLTDRPTEFNKKIKQVDRLRFKVKEYDRAYNIITAGAQMAEFRKFSADQRLKASGAVGIERAKRQLDRDTEFVRSLRDDTDRMIAIMEESVLQFDSKITHDETE